jgi:hypothetical protein
MRGEKTICRRGRLNHLETERQLKQRLKHCYPLGRVRVADELARASRCEGPTVFDWLVEIIQENPDWVTLKLE